MPVRRQRKPVLQIENLCVERNGTSILKNVSWVIDPEEHWVILGANGSGKTSLLSTLTGYLMPTEGGIQVMGEAYGETDWRELRKKIGIVSSVVRQKMSETETALESIVSGKYAMIDFWGKPSRQDRSQALRILKQIRCEHLRNRPWRVLSQGERQRVLIGRALMARPAMLILDEPCAGLDPVAREHFLQFLSRLLSQKHSPTLVLVTHHVEEIQPGFSHVMLLREGEVLAAGPGKKVLTSRLLSATLDAPVWLRRVRGRFNLSVRGDGATLI